MSVTATYSTQELASLAKCSPRQLQWWDQRSLIPVRHEGHKRMWSREDALLAMIISHLRTKGLSLLRLRNTLRTMQRHLGSGKQMPDFMLTDGRKLWFAHTPTEAVTLLDGLGPVYFVCIAALRAKLS